MIGGIPPDSFSQERMHCLDQEWKVVYEAMGKQTSKH
jgi:hypothetical protein